MALDKNITTKFRKAFEDDCIELIVEAYNKSISEKKYKNDWFENDFSELLSHYVNENPHSIEKEITNDHEE